LKLKKLTPIKDTHPVIGGFIPVDELTLLELLKIVRESGKPVIYLDVALWKTTEELKEGLSGEVSFREYEDKRPTASKGEDPEWY
jgi:hypothetical protein